MIDGPLNPADRWFPDANEEERVEPHRCRVAVVGTGAIFRKRAGNAAYLASLCRAFRSIGCRVEVFFIDTLPRGHTHVDQHQDYMDSADAVAVRNTVRFGARFVVHSPGVWARATIDGAASGLGLTTTLTARRARRSRRWQLRWPTDRAIAWAKRQLSVFRPHIVVANYFNASRVFAVIDPNCVTGILVHDLFALRKESYEAAGYDLDFDERMVAAESEAFASADVCLTITEDEGDHIRRVSKGAQTVVFPFVTEFPSPRLNFRGAPRCLFVASDNDPNRKGLEWLLRHVWTRIRRRKPDATLRVVGNIQPVVPNLQPGVEFAGVADDLHVEYAAASLALVPLRAGSGLKIKLAEALAHGVPVVSTTAGASGVASSPTRFLRIHDDPEPFAEAAGEVLVASDWADLSAAAMTFAQTQFSEAAAQNALRRAFWP